MDARTHSAVEVSPETGGEAPGPRPTTFPENPHAKGHPWTWTDGPLPGLLAVRVCATDGVPGHDLHLRVTERDVERMKSALELRRKLREV